MDIKDLCNAIDKHDNKSLILSYAMSNDIIKLNEYSKSKTGQPDIVQYYNFTNEISICDSFYEKHLNISNPTEELLQEWNTTGYLEVQNKIDEFADIFNRNKDKYMEFGYNIANYINNIDFLKISAAIEFRRIRSGNAFFVLKGENIYIKIYIPMFEEFEKFDQQKFLIHIKFQVYEQVETNILDNYHKTRELSLNDKYHLVHIATKLDNQQLIKQLYEHRSKFPKHLKDLLLSSIIANKLRK